MASQYVIFFTEIPSSTNSKRMTGVCCVLKFLRGSMDEKYLMHSQSEVSVFKFLLHSVHTSRSSFLTTLSLLATRCTAKRLRSWNVTRFVISLISQDVYLLRRKERIIYWRNVRYALLEELSHVKKMWPLCSGNAPSPSLNANLRLKTWSSSFLSHTYLLLPSGDRNLRRQRASADWVWVQWQVCSVSAM